MLNVCPLSILSVSIHIHYAIIRASQFVDIRTETDSNLLSGYRDPNNTRISYR